LNTGTNGNNVKFIFLYIYIWKHLQRADLIFEWKWQKFPAGAWRSCAWKTEEKAAKLPMVPIAYCSTGYLFYCLHARKSIQITNNANCLQSYGLLVLPSTRFQPVWGTEEKAAKLPMMPVAYCSTGYLFYCLHAFNRAGKRKEKQLNCQWCQMTIVLLAIYFTVYTLWFSMTILLQKAFSPLSGKFCPQMAR
jgi:hypothetical protein